MRHTKKITHRLEIPQKADSLLEKQQQIDVANNFIKMLDSLFSLLKKICDTLFPPAPSNKN